MTDIWEKSGRPVFWVTYCQSTECEVLWLKCKWIITSSGRFDLPSLVYRYRRTVSGSYVSTHVLLLPQWLPLSFDLRRVSSVGGYDWLGMTVEILCLFHPSYFSFHFSDLTEDHHTRTGTFHHLTLSYFYLEERRLTTLVRHTGVHGRRTFLVWVW